MNDIATAQHQDAFASKRRQLSAQLKMERARVCFVDAELHHRYVGVGVSVPQYRPGPVIEPPTVIEIHAVRMQ
jgi:hypothetical protein